MGRDLALVKVGGTGEDRVEALRIGDIFRCNVVDSTTNSFVFEVVGTSDKVDAFIDLMKPLGLIEVSRTGVAAIARGAEGMLKIEAPKAAPRAKASAKPKAKANAKAKGPAKKNSPKRKTAAKKAATSSKRKR